MIDTWRYTTYNTWYMSSIRYVNQINNSKKQFFTFTSLSQLFDVKSSRTLEDIIRRLIDEKVLILLEKGKYQVEGANPTSFEVAQFLYSPSYISFETALNYHGILSQFPMEITSATTKKGIDKVIEGKNYVYAKLNIKLYTGYYKEGECLMALPEKALFDQLYMIAKGIKTEQYLDEMDFSNINKQQLLQYSSLLPGNLVGRVHQLAEVYL